MRERERASGRVKCAWVFSKRSRRKPFITTLLSYRGKLTGFPLASGVPRDSVHTATAQTCFALKVPLEKGIDGIGTDTATVITKVHTHTPCGVHSQRWSTKAAQLGHQVDGFGLEPCR